MKAKLWLLITAAGITCFARTGVANVVSHGSEDDDEDLQEDLWYTQADPQANPTNDEEPVEDDWFTKATDDVGWDGSDSDEEEQSEQTGWDLSNPGLDHMSEAIARSGRDDHDGAVDAFRAGLKFASPGRVGSAHLNLGVALMRKANFIPSKVAAPVYAEALEHMMTARKQGQPDAQNNLDAMEQNCKLRYDLPCSEALEISARSGPRLGSFSQAPSPVEPYEEDSEDEDDQPEAYDWDNDEF